MGHHHDHSSQNLGDSRLIAAVFVNVLLTLAQVIGGILSGSLSLVADAIHNLSDATALGIALFARKVSRKPADSFKTFGYKRAETIAALINLTTLILIGVYLFYEAIWRFIEPREIIDGWTVIIIAAIAFVIDIATAFLTITVPEKNFNIKAAFLHNVSDALASLGVILAGILIILYGWNWTDSLLTLIIAGFVLWQGFTMLPKTIHLLMNGKPGHLTIEEVISAMESSPGVKNVHHVHIWQLDENRSALEAHVVTKKARVSDIIHIKNSLKNLLLEKFNVGHSTIEFEFLDSECGVHKE